MRIAKRLFLFLSVNLLIVATITTITSLLGIQPYLSERGIDIVPLIVFSLLWGFGGAFISLALSRKIVKWTMGVKLIDPHSNIPTNQWLHKTVSHYAQKSELPAIPEIGIYDSPDINAFATGPSRSRALVAVSTGLLERMTPEEAEGVIGHEVAHIANGDMVTMTLLQGVVNSLVIFVARIAGWIGSQAFEEEKRPTIQFAIIMFAEIILGLAGMLILASFSREREFRADRGGADLSGKSKMIAALQALKRNANIETEVSPSIAALQISGKRNRALELFSTHPPLEERIRRLKNSVA